MDEGSRVPRISWDLQHAHTQYEKRNSSLILHGDKTIFDAIVAGSTLPTVIGKNFCNTTADARSASSS